MANKRNERIQNSIRQLNSFSISSTDEVESVYHVLMPSTKEPRICLGEIGYDKINIANIKINGCINKNNPMNFEFEDGLHRYKFTPCDSQLYMDFENEKIILEEWEIRYLKDPFALYELLGKIMRKNKEMDFTPSLFEYTLLSA